MSIIYDALQKTQKQLNTKNQLQPVRPYRNWFDIILLSIIFVLLIVTLIAYYPMIKKYFFGTKPSAIKSSLNVQIPLHSPKIKLELNGIFISDKEKVAQINNQLVTVGEMIGGYRVIEITSNKVKLLGPQGTFHLQSESFP